MSGMDLLRDEDTIWLVKTGLWCWSARWKVGGLANVSSSEREPPKSPRCPITITEHHNGTNRRHRESPRPHSNQPFQNINTTRTDCLVY